MAISEFAFGVITGLVANAIDHTVSYGALEFFQRRKIGRRVEDAVAEVVQPLIPFLKNEHIKEYQQELLIQACVDELKPLAEAPEKLFQASLDGQKIFDNLYGDRDLPREVTDEGLENVYLLLFPRIATLLCKIPAAVKDWENQAWTENYRRLDEITAELTALFKKVDSLANDKANEADDLLQTARRTIAQKIAIELDLTGLRSDKPLSGKFNDFFVYPEIVSKLVNSTEDYDTETNLSYEGEQESFNTFVSLISRTIVFGAPGAGKSTWSKWLQRIALSKDWQGIAIRVELRNLAQKELVSFPQLIRETVGRHLAEGVTSNKINQWIKQRQIIFILDGFDEIPPEKRDEIQQWIQELNIAIKNCPIVITSRPLTTNHLEELGEQWELFEIKPFDEPRIIDYIQRWYKYTSLLADSDREINVKVLAQQWQSDPTIEPLTSNPLLLSTLLMVHHLDGSLPSGRSELYNRYVKGMLGLWDDRRKVKAHKISLSLKEKWQILRGIALYMNFEQKDQLDEGEITQQLDRILEEMKLTCSAEDVLETLRERSGLIIGPGIYSFIHKSVGEYLVADAINQGDQRDTSGTRIDRLTLFDYRDKDRWNTIIFLWAGIASVKDLENFIDSCIEAKSYRLALGILYDQYEKFSTIYRKNLIDKLLCGQIELGFPQRSVYYKYYAPFDYYSTYIPRALKIRSYNLRSITEDIGIERLLLKVVNKGDVSWSNMKNPQNEIRDFLWTFFTVKIENFDDWKKSIAADPPCNGNNELWFILTADRIAFKFFYGQIDFNVDQVYQKCEETISSLQGLIIIYLINAVVQIDIDFFCKDDVQLRLNQTLNFILNAPKESIDSNLLEGTKIWICYALDSVMDIQDKTLEEIFDVQDIKDLDLLLNFKNKIQSLFDMGSIIDQNTFQSVIKFTDDLIKMRDDAVLVSREDGKAIAETIYLNSIPGMVDSIKSAAAEPLSEGMPLEELDW